MLFDAFLDAFLDQFWCGFWPPFWVPFWGLRDLFWKSFWEVPKVDSEHPYTTLKGFYMSPNNNKKMRFQDGKKTCFLLPNSVAF